MSALESLLDWDDPAVLDLSLVIGAEEISVLVGINLSDYPLLAAAVAPHQLRLSTGNAPHHESVFAPPPALELRHAISVALLEPAVELLEKCGVSACRIMGIYRRTSTDMHDKDRAQFQLSLRMQGRAYKLIISVDENIQALTRLVPRRPRTVGWPLRLPGRLILGVKRLPFTCVRALATGDVILRALFPSFDTRLLDLSYDAAEPTHGMRAWAAWGAAGLARASAPVDVGSRKLLFMEKINMSDKTHFENITAPPAASTPELPIDIGEIELPVSFELEVIKLSLTELTSIGAGYVLELDSPVSKAHLRLVVHGQTIGYGELVAVGEHLGVRILRMASGYESTESAN